ncbi:isopeptide-forming domain-containing fimbrial protein [Desulfococcaceae bacterium HSG9]|nr:isopeptide-forming domain-containing fimbrial protein [Desulfococcaceae bacterium HSG9]
MKKLGNMMNRKKHHFIMYIVLVFAVLLTAPAVVCGGNDAYSYKDYFENSLGLDMDASHGFAISDGKIVSYAADAKAVSECIRLIQPAGSTFLGWSCLQIDLENPGGDNSLAVQTCDDGSNLKTVNNLITGNNTVDLSDINPDETEIRLEWSTSQTGAKADSWKVYGEADGATVIDVVAGTDTPNVGDTITFTIPLASSGAVTHDPVLRFSLDDINGLHTPDIDDGLAEDAEVDYGSGVNSYRPLKFVSASNGPSGEVPADLASGAVSGEVVWKLKDMTDGFSDNVTVTLKIPRGYINGKTLSAQATLEHGACDKRMTLEATSAPVTVKSVPGQYEWPWASSGNLGPDANNIVDTYLVGNTLPHDANKSDVENVTFTITGIGDCTPLFSDIDVWDPYHPSNHRVRSTHQKGDPITTSNQIIVEFDRINFFANSARVFIYYDLPEGCSKGNTIGTQSEVAGGNPEWNDLDKILHNVVLESCRRGNNHVHRLMSGNDPGNYFRWYGVGEFYLRKGSLRAGEYFSTWAPYGNEYNRTHTISLDHSYDLMEIPAGVTFHGVRSTSPSTLTRFYKDCTGTAPEPTDTDPDTGFDHNADPPHPDWKPIDSTWDGPFTNPPDDNDPDAVVLPECRLLSIKDNDNPAWQGPDNGSWYPRFLWRVCDGSFSCTELPEKTAMSLGEGDIYTYETETNSTGAARYCFSHDGWTVYKESKSWPKVYAWPEQDQTPAGKIASIIVTPENSNLASQYVDGRWAVNLYDVREYIDLKGVTGEVLTDGLNIPKPDQNVMGESCDYEELINPKNFHPPVKEECNNPDDAACMAWWEVPEACQPPNGWGYRDGNNNPADDFLQMFRFRLNAPILKTTPANTVLDFVAECRTNDLSALGADNAVDTVRWPVSNCSATASVTVLETPGLDIDKTGPVNRKAGDLFTYNLELTNIGNAPSNGWYWVDWLPKEGLNESDFTPEYRKLYINRPKGDVIAQYSKDEACFADLLGVDWNEMMLLPTDRTGFQAETLHNINAEAKCIRLRNNPDAEWNFNPGDKIFSVLDFEIPVNTPEGQRICNRALTGASVDFGGTSDLYPVETVNVCTEVNEGVKVKIKKTFKITPQGIEWTIKVWNASGTVAKNITVTDDLPDTMSYQGIDGSLPVGWNWEPPNGEPGFGTIGGQFNIIIEELTPDDGNPGSGHDEGTFTFLTSLTPDTPPGGIKNCATAIPEEGLGSGDCGEVPDLKMELGKTQIAEDRAGATPETELFPGDEFSYEITVKNTYSKAVSLRITDTLDDYLAYVKNTFTVNGAAASDMFFSDGTLDYRYPEMVNPGKTLTLKFDVKVDAEAPHGKCIENRAVVIPCTDRDDPSSCSIPQETPVVYACVVDTKCDFDLKARANRGQVQLTWRYDEGMAPYDVYRREKDTDTGFRRIEANHPTTWATYLDRNDLDSPLQTGTMYDYYVVNSNGCRSEVVSSRPQFISDVLKIVNLDEDGDKPVTLPDSSDEDGDKPVTPPDSSDEDGDKPVTHPDSSDEDGDKPATPPDSSDQDGDKPATPPDSSDEDGDELVIHGTLDEGGHEPVTHGTLDEGGHEPVIHGTLDEGSHEDDDFDVNYTPQSPEPDPSPVPVPVYRFYSEQFNAHHFCDEVEKDYLIDNYPKEIWKLEKAAFYVFRNAEQGTAPVYRLYNEDLKAHLFTIDENEKDTLADPYSQENWLYEGVAFYVDPEHTDGTVPVYRLYSEDLKTHLFTMDANEKDELSAQPGWNYEGVAYYVYAASD